MTILHGCVLLTVEASLCWAQSPVAYSTIIGNGVATARVLSAVDTAGNLYLAGTTNSAAFPTTPGALQPRLASGTCYDSCQNPIGGPPYPCNPHECADCFLAKLDPSGARLLYATYLGGTGDDVVTALAVDVQGSAYVAGRTTLASTFPVTPGAVHDADTGFIAKVNPTGGALIYSALTSPAAGVVVDSSGDAFLATGEFSRTGLVRKLNPAGTSFAWSLAVTGAPAGIAIDGAGNVYVAATSVDSTPAATGENVVISKINASGSGTAYIRILGGRRSDAAVGIALDGNSNAYVTGSTDSPDFPTTPGAFSTRYHQLGSSSPADAFVTKLDASGNIVYSTYLGGVGVDMPTSIAVGATGEAYVSGSTSSRTFPTTRGAVQPCIRGEGNAFLTRLSSDGSALVYSTYFGGSVGEDGISVSIDGTGNAYLGGVTSSADFPVTIGTTELAAVPGIFAAKLTGSLGPPLSADCVVNGASYSRGALSPGEIVTIFNAIGPSVPVSGEIVNNRWGSAAGGVRVLFNGAAAPVLYAQEKQINTIVPYGVLDQSEVAVQVEYNGQLTNAVQLGVVPAAPGAFTAGASGIGQGAILNQDGSLNSAANPAKPGQIISLFGTGEGMTDPPAVDGAISPPSLSGLPRPRLPVQVYFLNVAGEVVYAGAAPTLTAGVLQINVRIPSDLFQSGATPAPPQPPVDVMLKFKVGDATSQAVTVSVQP